MEEKSGAEMYCNDMSEEDELTCGGAVAVIVLAVVLSGVFWVKMKLKKLIGK